MLTHVHVLTDNGHDQNIENNYDNRSSVSISAVQNILVHGQVTIILVCLFVCLFACAKFFSAVFDPISTKLGHMLYVWV